MSAIITAISGLVSGFGALIAWLPDSFQTIIIVGLSALLLIPLFFLCTKIIGFVVELITSFL